MAVRLLLAPAAAGKTAYALHLARDATRGLQATPRVVVPTHLQVQAWRRRLAETGGALGARLLTFDGLYAECLNAAGEAYTELSDPVQYRLIRSIVDDLALRHYAPLAARPGFIQVLEGLIGELKAARVYPEDLVQAVEALGGEPRLRELAQIYTAYQARLQAQGWADRAGLGWLAVEALEERARHVASTWRLLVVDGFDNFTPVQLSLLRALSGRVGTLIITLTGTDCKPTPQVHRRFARTREQVENALGVTAEALPPSAPRLAPALAHLGARLFREPGEPWPDDGVLALREAPDRAAEVREALRWLKTRVVEEGMAPGDVALLARHVAVYRPFVMQIADEYGLPVRIVDGLPLRANPAITALLNLLRLVLPQSRGRPEPALPRRRVVEAWRSPYFDWSAQSEAPAGQPIGIGAGDADRLDVAARYGRVMGGLSQWTEALGHLAQRMPPPSEDAPTEDIRSAHAEDEEQGVPEGVPLGPAAHALGETFRRFVQRLTPPPGEHSYRAWVQWLEDLIGPDPTLVSPRAPVLEEPTALQIVDRARDAPTALAERDLAALRALKDVLRGLVWAEEALSASEPVGFARFFDELVGAVEGTRYHLPTHPEQEEILVADVVQARGLTFRAVAVVGLAEGEFPATLSEDPFLRDADRERLREECGLLLEPSTRSAEVEFFYETVTRPRERLCLTRPRLDDNGALWPASPFWEEARRRVQATPRLLTSDSIPPPAQVASWAELMESLAAHPGSQELWEWVGRARPDRQQALEVAADVLRARLDGAPTSAYDGDLRALRGSLAQQFGPGHIWSASRLETYRTCPFFFFVEKVLGLEPRPEPVEGLDARQLGSIYHRLLEHVYQAPDVDDPTDVEQLQTALPVVAQTILDAAPEQEGFRETAWWAQTRAEIVVNVRRSLEALAALQGDYAPSQHEAVFGLRGRPALVVAGMGDTFRLRGVIDRIDRAPGDWIRVIDYKTAGPGGYTKKAVAEGKKLQLPLYALAARDALNLGEPAEGFYWHVRHAKASAFQMSAFDGGPDAAMEAAVAKAWEAVQGVREGHFVPHPPDDGCPTYCPAAAFCWQYAPRFGG
jgi:ATP-dependent helicase/DNAse subunit B